MLTVQRPVEERVPPPRVVVPSSRVTTPVGRPLVLLATWMARVEEAVTAATVMREGAFAMVRAAGETVRA